MGIETVKLEGKGFDLFVNVGDKVHAGDKIATMDLEYIESNATSSITPVIFTNLEENEKIKVKNGLCKVKENNRINIKNI